jgi:hypothetical protein
MANLKPYLSVVTSLAFLTISMAAEARPFRVSDIPNGSKFGCLNCHGDTKASYNTDFGSDARTFLIPNGGAVSTEHVNWASLCPLDSDRDGWTNGEELGDPECMWKSGDPNPMGLITNPGVYESAPPPVCGSGFLEANEQCDGDLYAETNCAFVSAGEGTLGCTAECKFDYTGCSAPPGTQVPGQVQMPVKAAKCSIEHVGSVNSREWSVLVIMGMVLAAKRIRSRSRD